MALSAMAERCSLRTDPGTPVRQAGENVSDQKEQGARHNERQPGPCPAAEVFLKDEPGKEDGHQDAEFINGNHHAGRTELERAVVTQPGGAGGKAGKDQENPAFAADLPKLPLPAGHEDHHPGHAKHHNGADGGAEVRVDVFHARLAQNGGEAGEHCAGKRIEHPAAPCLAGLHAGLFLDHQPGAQTDQNDAGCLERADGLVKKDKGQKHGEQGAGFIDGSDLVHIAQLKGAEIAQPGGTGGEP